MRPIRPTAYTFRPRWQPAAPKQSEDGSAATTPLSPATCVSESPQAPRPTIRHSLFLSVFIRVHLWLKKKTGINLIRPNPAKKL